jgi:hypothetical protein
LARVWVVRPGFPGIGAANDGLSGMTRPVFPHFGNVSSYGACRGHQGRRRPDESGD